MKHTAIITKKPQRCGKYSVVDGAINGNGDLAVILGNSDKGMRIFLSKSDIWYAVELHCKGGLRPLADIDIDIPASLYDSYYVEQRADEGCLFCRFEKDDKKLQITITVCKTENTVIIDIDGNYDLPAPRFNVFNGSADGKFGKTDDGIVYRIFDGEECGFKTEAYASMKEIGDGRYCIHAVTNHDTENPEEKCREYINSLDKNKTDILLEKHSDAWKDFWSKSEMTLSDKELEKGWYQSLYLTACCSGNEKFPPGLFGNFITVEYPAWKSDYHLNYNYQATFYAVCSSNHVELTDCYHAPLEEFIPKGREFAEKFGCKGIILPVGILPKGLVSEWTPDLKYPFLRLFLGQKNNQLHPADIMIFRWKATRDIEYAKNHAYPYLKECLQFFEDYATFEDGRYSICKDAAHEVPYYKPDFTEEKYKKVVNDKNNTVTLGLMNLGLEAAIDMAKALGVDEDKQAIWQNMLDKLSPFTVFLKRGKRVFRYTEKGQAWNPTNSIGLQHIYPCGAIDLNSDEKTLKIARNSLTLTNRWFDFNASNSVYPAAVRIGIKPEKIMKMLRLNLKKFLFENYLHNHEGGGLENCSIIPNTINEMALQSNKNIMRFFPCWDKSIDCEFKNLRANGAFLVSGSMKNGKIGEITVESEKGEKLCYINPVTSEKIALPTKEGEIIRLNF